MSLLRRRDGVTACRCEERCDEARRCISLGRAKRRSMSLAFHCEAQSDEATSFWEAPERSGARMAQVASSLRSSQ